MSYVALPLPSTLSPTKVSTFRQCALAFRFSAVDRLAEAPTIPTVRGTLVHRALERLFWHLGAGERSLEAALENLRAAEADLRDEIDTLDLDDQQRELLSKEAETLVRRYFELENPAEVQAVGVELKMDAVIGGVRFRGIIDRLDLDPEGNLVVVDYKTGRPPSLQRESTSLAGVHFYALLCEQVLGLRPLKVRLLYLGEPLVIEASPSDQGIRGLEQRTGAIWRAVQLACAKEDFRPRPSPLCGWCSWKEFCPAFGGDPSSAKAALDPRKIPSPPLPLAATSV